MIKSRKVLEKELSNVLRDNLIHKRVLSEWIKEAEEKYDMPEKVSHDYIHMQKDLIEANTFALFILTDVVKHDWVEKYYSKNEIKGFSKEKWNVEKIKFPLRYQMTKINDEQYIGKISVKELMLLKDAQLIRYNENAQRTMQHIVRGKTEYYRIALNKDAVYHIMDSYESDLYIPNTITLNLPDEADFYFDNKNSQLVIQSTDYFDILDGYHRYVALSKLVNQDPDFDYEMELRIVQFEENKAKRFIWQEDQKTKMRKIDSESMDTSRSSNKIVERINLQSESFGGKISRNKGIINAAYLANIIDVVMLKEIKKSDERLAIRNISFDLMDVFENLVDKDKNVAKKPWSKLFTYMIVYETRYGNPMDVKTFYDDLRAVEAEGTIYNGPSLTTADITRTHKLLRKEV